MRGKAGLAGKATAGLDSSIGTPGKAPGPGEESTLPHSHLQADHLWIQATRTRAKKPSQRPQPLPQPGCLSSGLESSRGSSLTQRALHSGKVWAKGSSLSLGTPSNGDPRSNDILSPEQTSSSTLRPQQPHVPDLCSPTAPLQPLLGPPHRWEPGLPHAGGSAHVSPALAKPLQEKGKGRNRPGEDPTGAQGPAEVAVWHTWAR